MTSAAAVPLDYTSSLPLTAGADDVRRFAPTRGDLALIALVAVALRVFITAVSPHMTHEAPFAHAPLWMYAYWGDGPSYLAQARAMCGDASRLTDFDRRVFPGFPALIALVHTITRIPFEYAALLIPWLCSGLAAAATAVFFTDRRLGWAMALLIPHYLSYSSMPMSEAPLLAFTLGGILLARRDGVVPALIGGVLLGVAGMIRPVAAFAVIGFFCYDLYRRRHVEAWTFAVTAGVVVGIGIGLMHFWTHGDALHGVHVYANDKAAYDGQLFTWPFHSLISTPHRADLPHLKTGKIAYIWIHVALALTACAILARRTLTGYKTEGAIAKLDVLCLPWMAFNTLFVLCVGSKWGFLAFPRFVVPAMPAAFWAYRRVLPNRWWAWLVIAMISVVIAVDSVKRMN